MCKIVYLTHSCGHGFTFCLSACLGAYSGRDRMTGKKRKCCRRSPYMYMRLRSHCGECDVEERGRDVSDLIVGQQIAVDSFRARLDDPASDWRSIEDDLERLREAERVLELLKSRQSVEKVEREEERLVPSNFRKALAFASFEPQPRRERGSLLRYEVLPEDVIDGWEAMAAKWWDHMTRLRVSEDEELSSEDEDDAPDREDDGSLEGTDPDWMERLGFPGNLRPS